MAEVWGARVEGPEGFIKPVAMKFILENFSGDTEFERLFVNEARVAARLQHANLVAIFDFDRVPPENGEVGRYYIAMERVDGHDLRRVFQTAEEQGKPFSHQLSLHVAGEVLKGLRYVHERRDADKGTPLGLIHRDVSPHNVLVGLGGEVKLSDFGIAKAMTQSLGTQSGMIRGKLSYASPEQLRAEAVDHRTDQFALGIALWEMLSHRRLFDGADEVEIIGKVLRCEIPPIGETILGTIHPGVEAIVRRMLSPSKDDRYPTTAAALSAVLTAPGYTHDGTMLSDLMHELFPEVGNAALNATVRLDTPSPLASASPHALTPNRSGSLNPEPGKETRTITGGAVRSASGPYGLSDRGHGSPGGASGRTGPGRRDPVTGSSYVSDFAEDPFSLRRRRSPWPWVVGLVASAGLVVGGVALFRPSLGAGSNENHPGPPRSPGGGARSSLPQPELPPQPPVQPPVAPEAAEPDRTAVTVPASRSTQETPTTLEQPSRAERGESGHGRDRAEHGRPKGHSNKPGNGNPLANLPTVSAAPPTITSSNASSEAPKPTPKVEASPKPEPSVPGRGPAPSNSAPIIP